MRTTLTEAERQQVNDWLTKCCTFSSRSLVTYAPSSCCHVDGISIALTASGSLIVINGSGGQYVKARDAEDEAVLRLLRLR